MFVSVQLLRMHRNNLTSAAEHHSGQLPRTPRFRTFFAGLLAACLVLAVGCTDQSDGTEPAPSTEDIASAETQVPPTELAEQSNEPDPAVVQLEATISQH